MSNTNTSNMSNETKTLQMDNLKIVDEEYFDASEVKADATKYDRVSHILIDFDINGEHFNNIVVQGDTTNGWEVAYEAGGNEGYFEYLDVHDFDASEIEKNTNLHELIDAQTGVHFEWEDTFFRDSVSNDPLPEEVKEYFDDVTPASIGINTETTDIELDDIAEDIANDIIAKTEANIDEDAVYEGRAEADVSLEDANYIRCAVENHVEDIRTDLQVSKALNADIEEFADKADEKGLVQAYTTRELLAAKSKGDGFDLKSPDAAEALNDIKENDTFLKGIRDRDPSRKGTDAITFSAENIKRCSSLKSALAWTKGAEQAKDGSVTISANSSVKTKSEMTASVKEAHAAKTLEKDAGAEVG